MEIFFYVGVVLLVLGSLWLLAVAFNESIWWGLGCIIVPFVSMLFIVSHFKECAKPILLQLAGLALMLVVPVLTGAGVIGSRAF